MENVHSHDSRYFGEHCVESDVFQSRGINQHTGQEGLFEMTEDGLRCRVCPNKATVVVDGDQYYCEVHGDEAAERTGERAHAMYGSSANKKLAWLSEAEFHKLMGATRAQLGMELTRPEKRRLELRSLKFAPHEEKHKEPEEPEQPEVKAEGEDVVLSQKRARTDKDDEAAL